MIHTPATVEDQLVLRAIKEECSWETLPKRLQSMMGTKEEWHRRIIEHCIKKRLQWNTSFARKVIKEGEYYEEMMRYLRKNLALFPYHLAEYVCRVMRVSPFRYYCDMIFEVMKNEQPYDSIPNFSAADALRLTGIGRNEFIDIMNKCRSKKIMWKLNKSIVKEMLPTQPVDDFVIEPWWGVCLVNFTLEEFKKLSEEETATIDKICKEEANSFILFDPNVVKGLYQRGLVYFDAPVYPDDRIKVLKLEGFVSNREQSYEDPIEELLYAVFVVSSGNSTIAELATTLQADLSQLQAAASFACRLGWAVKLIDPGSVLRDPSTPHGAPIVNLIDLEDGANVSLLNNSIDGSSEQGGDLLVTENVGPSYGSTRVAFLVDANITSYLMMGSVSPGLKSHAVTLYEAGKLDHGSISDLCKDLSTLEGAKFEGELQEFANHAFSLRLVLECLTTGGITYDDKTTDVSYKLTTESSGNNENSPSVDESSSMKISADTDTNEAVIDNNSSEESNCLSEVSKFDADMEKDDKVASTEKRKYNVDMLRCESLAALSPTTLDRLFLRDYDIVVSMIPLPHSAVLPGAKGPVHFGPPCHSSMTPWMKMVLYSTVACGPLSVVLMKGQYLRLLPAPLAGCEKALIWSWDGSSVGGLGSKFEGDLVKGSILLHCLNSLLKYSGVLVQPLSKDDLDDQGRIVTMDVPLPLKNFDGSIAPAGEEFGLSNEENIKLSSMLTNLAKKMGLCTVGYIRLLRLFKETDLNHFSPDDAKYEWVPLSVDFGIPLFSPKLCNDICKRIVTSQLLQSDLHAGHHHAMQELRKKLRDTCAEYQAAGPAAKILHQREQPKAPSRLLMNYASGRWNPLVDPSSPISGASNDHHRIKLANRQRCGTEVLSFDGSILRSYALSPVHEAAIKPTEESFSASTGKAESDDANNKEVILPGVNLLFDGCELRPFDIGACLQARQPICLIAEASTASSAIIK